MFKFQFREIFGGQWVSGGDEEQISPIAFREKELKFDSEWHADNEGAPHNKALRRRILSSSMMIIKRRSLVVACLLLFLVVFVLVKDVVDFDFLQTTADLAQAKTDKHFCNPPNHDSSAAGVGNATTKELSCVWKPGNHTISANGTAGCVDFLVDRIRKTTSGRVTRWIFAGDSTMWRLFQNSPLHKQLARKARRPPCPSHTCRILKAERCTTAKLFGVKHVQTWQPPNLTRMEGPVEFGKENPYCHDCSHCDSKLLHCSPDLTSEHQQQPCVMTTRPTGGYVSVEFARDVEIQSTLYSTTQENLALMFLKNRWNAHASTIVHDLGRPVCVVSAGFHDVRIQKDPSQKDYLQNVKSYLQLLAGQCSHIIWLGNTSPKTDKWAQKKERTQVWNLAILDMLRLDEKTFSSLSSFVDVFKASETESHIDNIHMGAEWYAQLGAMFLHVVEDLHDATRERSCLE